MRSQPTAVERPIKLVIADDIRMRIEQGELAPGTSLPSIQGLCEQYSCSSASVRDALALLRGQGLVTGGRGKPLMVRVPHRRTVRSNERHQFEKDLVRRPLEERAGTGTSEIEMKTALADLRFRTEYERVPASAELAEVFQLEPGTELLRREYETNDPRTGRRTAWSESYIPLTLISANPDLLDSGKEPWPGGTQHQLYTVGIEIAEMIDEVIATEPTTVDRQLWGLDNFVPMLKVRRISIDTEGRVVEVSDAVLPGDRSKLIFKTPLTKW